MKPMDNEDYELNYRKKWKLIAVVWQFWSMKIQTQGTKSMDFFPKTLYS